MPFSYDPNGILIGLTTGSSTSTPTLTKITSGTAQVYTPPVNCVYIEVYVTAGGAGGGGGFSAGSGAQGSAGGGGSAGNYMLAYYPANQTFLYTIGSGGTAGAVGGNGGNGGNTLWSPSSTGIQESLSGGRAGNAGTNTRGGSGGTSLTQTITDATRVLYFTQGGSGTYGQSQTDYGAVFYLTAAFTDIPVGGMGGNNILASNANTGSSAAGGGGGGGAKNTVGRTGSPGNILIIEYY